MFARRNIKNTNERGALILEAIAMLGLMTMMSPMIVRQTADRYAESDEVTTAGQMKELKKALGAWISANYQTELANSGDGDGVKKAISATDLAPYLPAGYVDGAAIRGSKLAPSYKMAVRNKCVERSGGNCIQATMTGIILTDGADIDDRQASRIASMIGADGGSVPSTKLCSSLGCDATRIYGSQGFWVADTDDFVDDDFSAAHGGVVAATTAYSGSFSGDFLYRKEVTGLPDANSMFTDLDMQNNKIKNSGGLEVVNGAITINKSAGTPATPVKLSTTEATLNVTSVNINGSDHIHLNGGGAILNLNGNVDFKNSGNKSSLSLAGTAATLSGQLTVNLTQSGETALKMNKANNANLSLTDKTYLNLASSSVSLYGAGKRLYLSSSGAQMNAGVNLDMGSGQFEILKRSDSGSKRLHLGGYDEVLIEGAKGWSFTAVHGVILNKNFLKMYTSNGQMNLTPSSYFLNGNGGKLNMSAEQMKFNVTSASFSLTNTNLNVSVASSAASILLDENGLVLNASTPRLLFKNASLTQTSMFAGNDSKKAHYLRVAPDQGAESNATISFYANSGRIGGSIFQPSEKILVNASGTMDYVVQQTAQVSTADNGQTTGSSTSVDTQDASVTININGSPTRPHSVHNEGTDGSSVGANAKAYNRFRADPAFISVMNDIKITSRGGARLSEALPNYILKGFYLLTNSYGSGKWPCGESSNNSTCDFYMPQYSLNEMGLASGKGAEFNCNDSNHPAKKGGGSCTPDQTTDFGDKKYIQISLYKNADYQSCSSGTYCWAHPYLGHVPAPGRHITGGGGTTLYAEKEGVCPDGYQPVLTVTPNTFEMGRVLGYNPFAKITGSKIRYNFDRYDFNNANLINAINMIQGATRTGVYAETVTNNNEIDGWRVAMGTITPTSINVSGYIWNFGGIPANSWSAVAHTYCYFNPSRFAMPNMQIKRIADKGTNSGKLVSGNSSNDFSDTTEPNKNAILTPMDNPLLGTDLLK